MIAYAAYKLLYKMPCLVKVVHIAHLAKSANFAFRERVCDCTLQSQTAPGQFVIFLREFYPKFSPKNKG